MMKYLLTSLIAFSLLSADEEPAERASIDPQTSYVAREVAPAEEQLEGEEISSGFAYFYPTQAPKLPSSFYSYPGYAQEVSFFKNDGSGFEMADGSRYSVAWVDQGTLRSWKTHQVIVFFPCQEWFSFFALKAVNITNGTEVKVNLTEGPILSSPLIKRIEAIDPYTLSIRLSDGSIWGVWKGDANRFTRWMIGDVIMTGCSQSPNGEAILYNVTVPDSYRKYSFATFMGY